MTPTKVRKVIGIYRKKLEGLGLQKRPFPHELTLDSSRSALEHAYNMLDQMEEFIKQDRMDKVYRWLGFLQGVLWEEKIYTLDDLMHHNKKDPPRKKQASTKKKPTKKTVRRKSP